MDDVAAQLQAFDDLWAEHSRRWPPDAAQPNAFEERTWTLVCQPAPHARSAISDVCEQLGRQWPDLRPYRAGQLHLTIAGGGSPVELEQWLSPLRAAIERAAARSQPAALGVVGLGILNDAVIAQVLDLDGQLRQLVAKYLAACESVGIPMRERAGMHERLWWLTLARITGSADPGLRHFLARRRRRLRITEMPVDAVQLVETNKLFEPERTERLLKVQLGARPCPKTTRIS